MSVAVATKKKVVKDSKVQNFVLINLRNSQYILMNKKREKVGGHKNSAAFLDLCNPSWHYLQNGGTTPIRFIVGAPTIFENDLWQDGDGAYHTEQEKEDWVYKPGLIKLGYAGKDGDWKLAIKKMALKIGFKNGFLNLHEFGGDPVALMFVEYHHYNVDAPNHRTPKDTRALFQCLDYEKIAVDEMGNIDDETDSMVYVHSLWTKKGMGHQYTTSNKNKINATLHILGMQAGIVDEDYAQKHVAIRNYAKANSAGFAKLTRDSFMEKEMAIGQANALGVLNYNIEQAQFIIGPEAKAVPLLSCEGINEDARREELILFLINNPVAFRDFGFAIEAGKLGAVSGGKKKQ